MSKQTQWNKGDFIEKLEPVDFFWFVQPNFIQNVYFHRNYLKLEYRQIFYSLVIRNFHNDCILKRKARTAF